MKYKKFKHFTSVLFLFFILSFNLNFAAADTAPVSASTVPTKEELQKQLQDLENQIAGYQQQLDTTQAQKNTLANKIKSLQVEQSKLTLQIQATNLMVDDLSTQIDGTQKSIAAAQQKSDLLKSDIADTIFNLYQRDGSSTVSSLAASGGLTGYFQEVDNTQKISESLSVNLGEIKKLKADLEVKNALFEEQKQGAQNLLAIKDLQSNDLSSKVSEQNSILADTKGKEAQYIATLTITKQKAAEIRNQIYDLSGVSKQVTFGEALDIANRVSKQTGVRAALLLAILTQETNLGKNVGTCNRAGDPASKSWKVVMKPDRDQKPFLAITQDLGLNPDITPVSCPMHDRNGNQIGWGGGMGPAQFIPSTWMSHNNDVAAVTGHKANPWDINDAFVASALLLKANGAASGAGDAEWRAAMRYFSGGTNLRFRFYGDNVLALANRYQSNINSLVQ
jgi:membrane-bound lytic murein transglycosylase B